MGFSFAVPCIMKVEFTKYLENYLWPSFVTSKSSHVHMMFIMIMFNEKLQGEVFSMAGKALFISNHKDNLSNLI